MAYLDKRRADGAADCTIERECGVLIALLNLAIDYELLDRNRLRRLPVPHASIRERVISPVELVTLQQTAANPVWRAIMAGLQTGLRINKLLESHVEWVVEKPDGLWLYPSPGRSAIKGVPKALPLNAFAVEALYGKDPHTGGRFFELWKDAGSFKNRWQPSLERAGIDERRFHDLRRTFATWLTQCGVDYAVIRMLRGEPLPGSANMYIHNWDVPMRDAVTRLELRTKQILEGD